MKGGILLRKFENRALAHFMRRVTEDSLCGSAPGQNGAIGMRDDDDVVKHLAGLFKIRSAGSAGMSQGKATSAVRRFSRRRERFTGATGLREPRNMLAMGDARRL